MAQQLLRPKFGGYQYLNPDGTIRFCRHADGSVLIPSYIFLSTGEEVLSDIYTLFGLTAPTRPAAPSVSLLDTYSETNRRFSIHKDGWIRLGDKLTLSDGSDLVDALTTLVSATPFAPPATDSETWATDIWLPTGEKITTGLLAWVAGATPPITDVLAPEESTIKWATVDKNSVELVWEMGHDRSGPLKESVIYQDGVEIDRLASPTNLLDVTGLAWDTEYTYEIETLDVGDLVSVKSNPVTIRTEVRKFTPEDMTEGHPYDGSYANEAALPSGTTDAIAFNVATNSIWHRAAGGAWMNTATGGSGGLTYRYTTASVSAAHKDHITANTSGASLNITLPASPSNGQIVTVKDYASTFATNAATLLRNGNDIADETDDYALNVDGLFVDIVFGIDGWKVFDATTGQLSTGGSLTNRKDGQDDLLTQGGTYTISFASGSYDNKMLELDANTTLTPTAVQEGLYLLLLKCDGTARTVTWDATVKGTPPTNINTTDGIAILFLYDGTNFHLVN